LLFECLILFLLPLPPLLFDPSVFGTFVKVIAHVFSFPLRHLLQLSFAVTFAKFFAFFLSFLFLVIVFLFHAFLNELFLPFVISIVQEPLPQLSFFQQFLFGEGVFFIPIFRYVFASIGLILIVVSI